MRHRGDRNPNARRHHAVLVANGCRGIRVLVGRLGDLGDSSNHASAVLPLVEASFLLTLSDQIFSNLFLAIIIYSTTVGLGPHKW